MIKMVFAKLINLQLKGLPNLTRFGSGNSVEFHSLTQLSIEDCPKLKTFSSALTSADIKQSNEIEQMNCQYDIHPLFGETFMEVVIITQGERTSNTLFPKLCHLDLKYLPKLTSFCNFEGKSIEFPSLDELWLENCPKMQAFVSNSPDADIPTNKEEQVNSEQSLHANIQPLFDVKVQIPDLKFLQVKQMDMKKIWHHDQLTSDSFSKMECFIVLGCHNLLNIFPSNMLGRIQKIEELVIGRCNSLEEIFESPCMMEGIVANEDIEAVPRFLFSQLKELQLLNLPSLRSFYRGLYILEWPKLKELGMVGCNKVEILTSEFLSLLKSHGESQLEKSIQKPLFIVDKVAFPQVEELTLEWNWIVKEILQGKFSEYSWNLKVLELRNASKQSAICPCCFLYTLPNLERLHVYCNFLEEIFICEEFDCKELEIKNCAVLEAIILIEEEMTDNTLFPNLTRLELKDLPKLACFCYFVENAIELPSLATLSIDKCPNMGTFISNFTASVGRNLLRLEELWIENCCMVEEIFAKEDEVNEVVPRFPRLTLLILSDLSRLQSFYPMVHISEWPMLKRFFILGCDKIEISASKNLRFQVSDGESQHEMLLLDKVTLTNLESLGLDWKWVEKEALHEKLPEYLCKLKFLTFSGFRKGADICVFCLLKKLPNLEKLQVTRGFFKEVFLSEGLGFVNQNPTDCREMANTVVNNADPADDFQFLA
ncbi:hypothetical protein QYF36_011344 [Acer negundo]|nr:hypothetical protein QYF36_011344 [Acer negundo]